MSTRCQVGVYSSENQPIEDPEVLIYRHNDGYPEGILSEIQEYVAEFMKNRGADPEYLAARLTWMLCETRPGYISVGVGGPKCKHMDIEFYYRVDGDTGKVTAFQGWWPEDASEASEAFKPIDTEEDGSGGTE